MRFRNYEIRRHLKLLLQILSVFAFFSILLVLFSPVINQTALEASQNRDSINSQLSDQSTELRAMQTIITYIKTHPYGRVYAGLPTNWGATFTIGDIPVYQYLESQDVDEVGYTLRTASLMSQPEAFFDDSSLSDYYLFCVRYLIVPSDFKVHVAADVIKKTEFFTLLEIPGVHYFRLVELIGTIEENRYDIGVKSVFYQESSYLKLNKEFEVEWNGMMHLQALSRAENVDGVIVSDSTNLEQGVARAKVNLSRGAVLALSASYDPGWTAYVDKRPTQVLMLAPAIPGVYVPKGDHTIEFHYQGFKYYWELFALLFVTIICVNWGFMRKTKELISRRGLPASEVRSKIYETK